MPSAVETKTQENQIIITLSRPDKRNAFEPKMILELTKIFSDLTKNPENIHSVLLQGQGESFCAGADLQWMKSMANFDFDENLADSKELFKMFETMYHCPLPLIARVHGHCFGGALGLVAVSDVAIAEESTQFCFSEVRLGLAPAVISPFILKRFIQVQLRNGCYQAAGLPAQRR